MARLHVLSCQQKHLARLDPSAALKYGTKVALFFIDKIGHHPRIIPRNTRSMKYNKSGLIVGLVFIFTLVIPAHANNFIPLNNFGDNPGELTASLSVPQHHSQALVVLLHGCAQNGIEFAKNSSFTTLSTQHNFALLVPQQSDKNNIKLCFNWFSPQDIEKDQGETLSLVNMIKKAQALSHAKQVYIAGLSAGGAMASHMLVNYPRLFSAGAIVAGIPSPCADNLIKAISCMRSGPSFSHQELIEQITNNQRSQQWPNISIWYGDDDKVVNPANSIALAEQWRGLHQIRTPPNIEKHLNYQITQWHLDDKNIAVQLVAINQLTHGMPIKPTANDGGTEAPFILKSPLNAAAKIIEFWRLH